MWLGRKGWPWRPDILNRQCQNRCWTSAMLQDGRYGWKLLEALPFRGAWGPHGWEQPTLTAPLFAPPGAQWRWYAVVRVCPQRRRWQGVEPLLCFFLKCASCLSYWAFLSKLSLWAGNHTTFPGGMKNELCLRQSSFLSKNLQKKCIWCHSWVMCWQNWGGEHSQATQLPVGTHPASCLACSSCLGWHLCATALHNIFFPEPVQTFL